MLLMSVKFLMTLPSVRAKPRDPRGKLRSTPSGRGARHRVLPVHLITSLKPFAKSNRGALALARKRHGYVSPFYQGEQPSRKPARNGEKQRANAPQRAQNGGDSYVTYI